MKKFNDILKGKYVTVTRGGKTFKRYDPRGKKEEEESKKDKKEDVGRIIFPKEKTKDLDGRIIRPGDIVKHYKFGEGQIKSVDLKTYSVPFVKVEIFDGKFKGEEIYRAANEFQKKG